METNAGEVCVSENMFDEASIWLFKANPVIKKIMILVFDIIVMVSIGELNL
jgi:hypothetical protein